LTATTEGNALEPPLRMIDQAPIHW